MEYRTLCHRSNWVFLTNVWPELPKSSMRSSNLVGGGIIGSLTPKLTTKSSMRSSNPRGGGGVLLAALHPNLLSSLWEVQILGEGGGCIIGSLTPKLTKSSMRSSNPGGCICYIQILSLFRMFNNCQINWLWNKSKSFVYFPVLLSCNTQLQLPNSTTV